MKKQQRISASIPQIVGGILILALVVGVSAFTQTRKKNATWQILSFRDSSDKNRALFTVDYPHGMTVTKTFSNEGFPNGLTMASHPLDATITCDYELLTNGDSGGSIVAYAEKLKTRGEGTEIISWTKEQASTFTGQSTSRRVGDYTGYTFVDAAGAPLSGTIVFGSSYTLEFQCAESTDPARARRISDKISNRLPVSTVERIEQSLRDL